MMGGAKGRRATAAGQGGWPQGGKAVRREPPVESAKLIADLTVFFVQTVKSVIEAVGKYGAEYDAASLEEFVAAQMRALGAVVLEYCSRAPLAREGPSRLTRVLLRAAAGPQGPRRTVDPHDARPGEPHRALPLPLPGLRPRDHSRRGAPWRG